MIQWPIEKETGYKPCTTFWDDFTIAESFGIPAVIDTFNRAFANWKTNCKYLTELVMVLNWKIWQYYEQYPALGQVYNALWEKADAWACENLKDDELSYFYQTTD